MTNEEKSRISFLRESGRSYREIGEILGIPEATVKTFCRRSGLRAKQMKKDEGIRHCLFCGREVPQISGRKEKKFCSDTCRMKWWNEHQEKVNRKTLHTFECVCCHKAFKAYESAGRKYCCHECYIEDRFGGVYHD